MLSDDLVSELNESATRVGRITELAGSDASALIEKLANIYVSDRECIRWWESLTQPSKTFSYGAGDGLSLLGGLIDLHSDAVLVVTDDEQPPWPVYAGNTQDLVEMLRGCRFFEYILATPDLNQVVFDTHLNSLVVVGGHSGSD